MAEKTTDEITEIFINADENVFLINKDLYKLPDETVQNHKDRLKKNIDHLELIKGYKKEDGKTSIWTTEDFTFIDAAITAGKSQIA